MQVGEPRIKRGRHITMVSPLLDKGSAKSRYACAAVLRSAVAKWARTCIKRLMLTAAPALALGLSSVAGATTYTVNTLQDSSGVANTCSLRDAISAANGTPTPGATCETKGSGNDAINFSVTGTITLGSALPEVTDSQLTITGPAASGITIDGANVFQELPGPAVYVMQVVAGSTLNLNHLAIDGGGLPSGGEPPNGPPLIEVAAGATLNLNDQTIADAVDLDAFGAGIQNSGTLTVVNSVFSANYAENAGGILNEETGTITVTNSTFSDNVSFVGGAINNLGKLTVTNSTFSNNGAAVEGGAISNSGTLSVTNSTFSGNNAGLPPSPSDPGGAIVNSGTLTVTNSTFSGNIASYGGGGAAISNVSFASLKNTILANSSGGFGTPPSNCFGTIIDAGYNISDDASCGFAKTGSALNGDGVNPLLSPAGLADNGGPTQTIALEQDSPAIDAIPLADCTDQATPPQRITNDQRGFLRPDDREAFCDIGAYESNALRVANLDQFVSFCSSASCGNGTDPFAADSAGCPAGQAAYGFNAVLTAATAHTLTDLQINVEILTNGNQWKLPNGQLLAGGGAVALSATGAHESPSGGANTGTLKPGQSATVPFTICLMNRNRFLFLVDVYGNTVSTP
jgi:CSLREA domain-containing protein